MSFTRTWRTRASVMALAATSCLLVLARGAPVARAEGVVPVEGGWVATTSAGLPVSFVVQGGDVLNAHFGFKWGFCGSYESHLPNTDPIDAGGHWSFLDSRGQTIEATFVAPDRVEDPRASLRLSSQIEYGSDKRVYSIIRYALQGRSPGASPATAFAKCAERICRAPGALRLRRPDQAESPDAP